MPARFKPCRNDALVRPDGGTCAFRDAYGAASPRLRLGACEGPSSAGRLERRNHMSVTDFGGSSGAPRSTAREDNASPKELAASDYEPRMRRLLRLHYGVVDLVDGNPPHPVSEGLVTNLAHPGGNLTGVSWQAPDTATKRLEFALEPWESSCRRCSRRA